MSNNGPIGNPPTELSIVIPVWNEEEENIRELYLLLTDFLKNFRPSYQIIFADDGSQSRVFEVLADLACQDQKVTVVRLERNFGQAKAVLAAFEYLRADIAVTMDADLQYLPQEIAKLTAKIAEGYDMVCGCRSLRRDSFYRRIFSLLINKMMRLRTGMNLKDWGCSFVAVRKELIHGLKSSGANARFVKAIMLARARRFAEVKVNHSCRKRGRSRYSFPGLAKQALDFLLFYSLRRPKKIKPLFQVKEVIG